MKFTVDLTRYEYEGIKKYLASLGDYEKPSRQDVQKELQGIVSTYLQSENAISDFIYDQKNKSNEPDTI